MVKKADAKKVDKKNQNNSSKKQSATQTAAKVQSSKTKPKVEEVNKNENTAIGKYIFFKNPKYANFAKQYCEMSNEEINAEVEKNNFSIQEKIHIGNLLSNKASQKAEQGQYQLGKKLFYSEDKTKLFEKYYAECLRKTRVALQKICELNQMPKSAPKETLAERVADGYVSGKIPKCHECYGGRLRFNIYTGEYFCPGYIDGGYFYSDLGDDYIFCNKIFKFEDVKREEFSDKI